MTTATAQDFDQVDAAIHGVTAVFKSNPLTAMFGYAAEGLNKAANLTTPPLRLAYDVATGALSSPLDLLVSTKPELKGLVDAVKADPELASALNDAMTKDNTFLPGLIRMSSSEDGSAFLSTVEETLKDPEVRANLTLGLQNLAERDDVDFADFEELTNSLAQYDMEKPEESKARVVKAHLGMGLTEDDAEETLAAGRDAFWKNILQEPERLGGWIGNMMEKMGMPAGFAEAVASFIPGMIKMIGGAPEFIKSWMGPEWSEYNQEHIQPAIEAGRDLGRNNMTLAMNY